MKTKNIIRFAMATALILMIPLVAMQFDNGVNWSLSDFIVMGVLLFGSGLAYEFVASRTGHTVYRVAAGVAVVSTLLLIWMNAAVGLIGSGANPANIMYMGVPIVGIIGASMVRFRPQGMARTLFAMAIAMGLVPVLALIIGGDLSVLSEDPPGTLGVLALNAFYIMLFVASAMLFRHSASTGSKSEETV